VSCSLRMIVVVVLPVAPDVADGSADRFEVGYVAGDGGWIRVPLVDVGVLGLHAGDLTG
jgi:hypothetical protein